MENEKVYYQLYFKHANCLYYGSNDICNILQVYSNFSFKKDLELRIVTEKNPKSCWIW